MHIYLRNTFINKEILTKNYPCLYVYRATFFKATCKVLCNQFSTATNFQAIYCGLLVVFPIAYIILKNRFQTEAL